MPGLTNTDVVKANAMKRTAIVIAAVILLGAFSVACDQAPVRDQTRTTVSTSATLDGPTCRDHIELHSAAYLAEDFGKSEMWVLQNHRINLWQNGSDNRGRAVGKLLPGSRAVILDQRGSYYKVRSPLDKSEGWVNSIQVKKTLRQDVNTRKPC